MPFPRSRSRLRANLRRSAPLLSDNPAVWCGAMSFDLVLKPCCDGCGSTSDLYGSNCKHTTLCLSCGKTMAASRSRCHICGTFITKLIRVCASILYSLLAFSCISLFSRPLLGLCSIDSWVRLLTIRNLMPVWAFGRGLFRSGISLRVSREGFGQDFCVFFHLWDLVFDIKE